MIASSRLSLALTRFLLLAVPASGWGADFLPPEQLPPQPNFPDPLVMQGGSKVTTKQQWETQRRPELKALFQHYMYGRLPPTPPMQTYEVLFSDDAALGGKAKLSEVKITFGGPAKDHPLHVLLVVPKG